ncbi:hypothetical protein [Chryseobacterium pennipullorum]|uniref:DUF416 family protein n=1 Tax=Chryseobacterium pennipullorum TaxID=2258963 RepID=A0A3D9B270_9FLAO|nr:hypothetical protein [Chryseobacterium pennipullorum]REC47417.1 hypothetical protein DRF67_10240 [Chryseobacterium pennipullorum]
MNENAIKEKALNLSTANKIKFNLSCLNRSKSLYALFEEELKDDTYDYSQRFKNGSAVLTEFSGYILNTIFSNGTFDATQLDTFEKNVESLAPEDDEYSSYQAAIAVNIVLISLNSIKIIRGDESKVKSTIDYTLDIINYLKSEEFFTNNPDSSDEESEDYLDEFYERELNAEDNLLNRIEGLSREEFIAFNAENAIS